MVFLTQFALCIVLGSSGGVAEPRHLPKLVRHQRRVLPVRPAELQDEVGVVDL